MRFDIRMLLSGIVSIPAGIAITWLGFQESAGAAVFPAGKFCGPLVIVLGVVLLVITVRSMNRGE